MRIERFTLIAIFIMANLGAQTGVVYDDLKHSSTILGQDRHYAIYLPPDYETSSRSYPVLYLLHGAGDNHTGWVQFGEVGHIADKAINSGKVTPMIIVMPDAQTTRLGYYNTPDGQWNYEDYFFEELMPHIEQTYRIKSEKRYRAIAGLSMGGGGAFIYAMHRPDLFSAACPLSAYNGPRSVEQLQRETRFVNGVLDQETALAFLSHYNTLELIKKTSVSDLSSVRWYIDCGDDDFLYESNSLVHIALRQKNVKHEFRIRDGGHTWTYWRSALPEVLFFVSEGFHQY